MRDQTPPIEGRSLFELLLGFRLYQLRLFFDRSRYRVVLKSRRVGITYYMAWEIVVTAAGLMPEAFFPYDYIIISKRERDAKNVIRMVKKWVTAMRQDPALAPYLETTSWSKTEIEFARSGFRIVSETQSEDAGRGDGAHVFRDEIAFYRHSWEIQDSSTATILHDSRLRMTDNSTPQPPAGKGRLFYMIWSDKSFDFYSRHKITIDDAIAEGFPITIEDAKKGKSSDKFAQEFRCKFLGAGDEYFKIDLIQTRKGIMPANRDRQAYIIVGVDTASIVDMTAISINYFFPRTGEFWASDVYTIQGLEYRTHIGDDGRQKIGQDLLIDAILRIYEPAASVFDIAGNEKMTGDSSKVAGYVAELSPPGRIVGRPINHPFKAAYVPRIREYLETYKYRFDENAIVRRLDREALSQISIDAIQSSPKAVVELVFSDYDFDIVQNDFLKVKRVLTKKGELTYDTERDKETGHGDTFWSQTLAFSAVVEPAEQDGYTDDREFGTFSEPEHAEYMR